MIFEIIKLIYMDSKMLFPTPFLIHLLIYFQSFCCSLSLLASLEVYIYIRIN